MPLSKQEKPSEEKPSHSETVIKGVLLDEYMWGYSQVADFLRQLRKQSDK